MALDENSNVTWYYRQALAGEMQHVTGIDDVFDTLVRLDIAVTIHGEAPEAILTRRLRGLAALRHFALEPAAPPEYTCNSVDYRVFHRHE